MALGTWDEAFDVVEDFIPQLSLEEKVGIVSGVGWNTEKRNKFIFESLHTSYAYLHPFPLCAGNTSPVSELNIPSLCLDDGPAGLRIPSKGTTGLPAAINAASTFSRRLMHARGVILGQETHDKGTQYVFTYCNIRNSG